MCASQWKKSGYIDRQIIHEKSFFFMPYTSRVPEKVTCFVDGETLCVAKATAFFCLEKRRRKILNFFFKDGRFLFFCFLIIALEQVGCVLPLCYSCLQL